MNKSYWYCPNCREEIDPANVTFQELHDDCGHEVEWIEGIDIDRLREICAAERDGRCVVLPTNFETAEPSAFYQARFCPNICNEDHCEYCGFGKKPDNCTFKPYVAKLPRRRVYDAYCGIINLHLTRAEAEAALKGASNAE